MAKSETLKPKDDTPPQSYSVETAPISTLKPHPRNYRAHPIDQIAHLSESIKSHGIYKNIVVANDGTILAGHGLVLAAKAAGLTTIPIIRLGYSPDDPQALKLLIGDNEIENLAEQNDRALSEMLKQIKEISADELMGTGFDEMMLANLLIATHSDAEMSDFDFEKAWAGMPEYVQAQAQGVRQLIVHFKTEEDVQAFAALIDQSITDKTKFIWYPYVPHDEASSRAYAVEP